MFYSTIINIFFSVTGTFFRCFRIRGKIPQYRNIKWALRWALCLKLNLPIGDECKHESHQRQTSSENDDEAKHAVLIEGTCDSRGNTISYSAAGRKTVNRAGV